jgi:hypothetical protein
MGWGQAGRNEFPEFIHSKEQGADGPDGVVLVVGLVHVRGYVVVVRDICSPRPLPEPDLRFKPCPCCVSLELTVGRRLTEAEKRP